MACDTTILIGSDPEPLITQPTSPSPGDAGMPAPVQPVTEELDSGTSPSVSSAPQPTAPTVDEPRIDAGPISKPEPSIDAGPTTSTSSAPKGTLLWSSSVETGDTSDWDAANGYVFTESGTLEVVSEHPRTGSFAIRALLRASEGQAQLFYRTTQLHSVLGAWYYLPDLVTTPYWALMKLRNGRGNDDGVVNDTFDIVIVTEGNVYRVSVFDKEADNLVTTDVTVAPGQWFHIETDYRHEPDVGHLGVYVDGVEVYRTGPRSIGEAPSVEWGVGSTATGADPPGPVFIDDLTLHEATDQD